MAQAMAQEIIFVQTDPAFNIALEALRELHDQNRLQITHAKEADIENIEGNNPNDEQRFIFGNADAEDRPGVQAFSRTASSVIRMCMLEAANIRRGLWPRIGQHSQRRNMAHGKLNSNLMRNGGFMLANDQLNARRYWSKYDQLYPHFLIEQAIRDVAIGTQIGLPSMMIIFRNNFTEVIEITTTFNATQEDEPNNSFSSYVHVTCIVRSIKQGDNKENQDKPFTKLLKVLINQSKQISIDDSYFEEIRNAKTPEDLAVSLDHLKIDDDDKEEEKVEGEKKEKEKEEEKEEK